MTTKETTKEIILDGKVIATITLPDNTSEETWAEVFADYLPVTKSLDALKIDLINLIYDHAKNLHEQLTQQYSAKEMSGWILKESQARDYIDRGIIHSNLAEEAEARSTTLPDLTQTIIAKADYLHQQSSRIAGIRGRHSDAIALLQSREEVENYNWMDGW